MKKFALSSLLLALTFLHHVNGQLANTDQANNDVLRFNQTTGAFEGSFILGENTYSPFRPTDSNVGENSNRYSASDTSTMALGILLSCFLLLQFNRAKRIQR